MNKTALITGASSGIGREVCIKLLEQGYIVYGAARRMDAMKDLEGRGVRATYLDITDENAITKCVDRIKSETGRCDVLVNNAGYGSFGTVEDVPINEARRQIEVNLIGLASVTRQIIPLMRGNGGGRIINVSSTAGKLATPFGAWYHASKYAVEGFSDALRMEVRRFGISVVVVEPGFVKTEWGIIASDHLKQSARDGVYRDSAEQYAEKMHSIYTKWRLTPPERIAVAIVRAAGSSRPKTRYAVGFMAKPAMIAAWLLPDKLRDAIMRTVAGF